MNLFQEFEKSAIKHSQNPCVTIEDQSFTYEFTLAAAKRLAAHLREIAPGNSESETNIGLLAPNVPGFMVAYYGILAADKVVVPLNFLLNPNELMMIGMHAGIRIIIAAGPLFERASEMAKTLPIKVLRAEDFMAPAPVPDIPAVQRKDSDTAILMYTSGTTGNPKGVELTHTNILENCYSVMRAWNLTEHNTFICVLPLFHSFGMTGNLVLSALVGSHLVLIPQFHPQKVADAILKYKKVVFMAVAPMYLAIARMCRNRNIDLSPHIEVCLSGGAALPMDVKDAFQATTGIEIMQGYGLTEAAPVVSFNMPDWHLAGSIGHPIDGVQVQIWDENNQVVPVDVVGELMVHGKNVMKGYYKNPEATAQTISPDGWLHTGDMAKIDKDGFITIVGRKKELILCAGENIYPFEIEEVLRSHPAVMEAAVIGIVHPTKGEVPKAFVSLNPEMSVAPAALKQHCRDRLAGFKVPVEIEIIPEIPKSPTGKILKRVLAEGQNAGA